jgi:hypothetical protein
MSLAARLTVVVAMTSSMGGIVMSAQAAGVAAERRVAGTAAERQIAQGAPPTRLGPRPLTRPAIPAQPAPAQPVPVQPPPVAEPPPSSGPAPLILPKVDVTPLSAPDPDSVGVLDDAQGGLGMQMWRGTDRAVVARMMPLLPHRAGSPTVRDLMRRLLLTRATAPKAPASGDAAAAPGGKTGDKAETPGLLGLRIEALFAIGDLDGALKLFRLADPDRAGARLVQDEVEALFFNNDNSGACKVVREHAQSFPGVYWLQANAYCLALGGEKAKAGMVTELLGEHRNEVNPAFFTMMDVIGGDRSAKVDSLADPLALHISMMRAANLALPDDVVSSGRPAVLRAVALSPNADFALRLKAADGAFAAGALSVTQLEEIYASVPFQPDELAKPLSVAESEWGPRGRALLMRAAAQHDLPNARAELLQKAFQLGRDKGGLPIVLRAAVPLLAPIKPTVELMWFAADAGRALYAAGQVQDANAWYALARRSAAPDKAAAGAATALWPMAALAGAEGAGANIPAAFGRWWAQQPKDKQAAASALRAQRVLALLEANGIAVGGDAWAALAAAAPDAQGAGPSAAVLHMLSGAASGHRRGETVMLALVTLGDEGPAASAQAVEAAARALRAVGLQKEARALSLASMVAAGL